ncbi:MAG TPA: oxygen-dependent coproporphyrinogen oxidase [Cyclobacteriaceae bacterium]|nr:oxygen-dependent coproporphyrinogen oxidase [Cyclobacteriaceae bacterium]
MEKTDFISFIHEYQQRLCSILEAEDGVTKFTTDEWRRSEGGGGITRVMENGRVIEKCGVNTSAVHGPVSKALSQQLQTQGGSSFFACGVSVVVHPLSPMIPTAHANFRYFEMYDDKGNVIDRWFGGGCDLTPYYLFEDDVQHFHDTFKNSGGQFYPAFKKQCDEYFFNKHRGESRGVGGIFYDYMRGEPAYWFDFAKKNADAFIEAYLPIVRRRKNEEYSERHLRWQEIRRGRYVEFNLIHDRVTLFGLRSGGRTESILMSLPPRVRFEYHDAPAAGTEEAKLLKTLTHAPG